MIHLVPPDGDVVHSYSDSFTPLTAAQDALCHRYLPHWYNAVWPAATGVWGEYIIMGMTYDGTPEPTGFKLREET